MILMMIFIFIYFIIMSIKLYVLGGPRFKPPGVSRGSPRLHFIIMFMIMKLFVCCCCDGMPMEMHRTTHAVQEISLGR